MGESKNRKSAHDEKYNKLKKDIQNERMFFI